MSKSVWKFLEKSLFIFLSLSVSGTDIIICQLIGHLVLIVLPPPRLSPRAEGTRIPSVSVNRLDITPYPLQAPCPAVGRAFSPGE
jgi:hypothetical protein